MTFKELCAKANTEWQALQCSDKPRILVGAATCGRASGAFSLVDAIKDCLTKNNIDCQILEVGCIGTCYAEPMINIIKPGQPHIYYGFLTPELAVQIVESYLIHNNPCADLAMGTVGEKRIEGIPLLFDLPMLKPQVRIVLRNCGVIDPQKINHYIASGGYSGFIKCLNMTQEMVIEEIKKAGLRGRGGAGYPAGLKWELCRKSPGIEKYIICNADEGDPGAFMNRSLLEGDPHSVLEGMLIGAYAIGAQRGFIYCRAEKPLAIERMKKAIQQLYESGLAGTNIQDSNFNFDVELREGAGAFVCGEETALIASIEGKRGMPNPRPPFPAEYGLWGKPTNINNVETWANVAAIMQYGKEWYSKFGSEKSKGTKTFALAGKISRTGLIEVPFGIPLKTIIYDIGGGVPEGKKFKAVQTGGPSGGCIPQIYLDQPVDYESLAKIGSIVGSGGMIVMDEDTCMVDIAKFFMSFIQSESCGKCIPCRMGTKQMLDILKRITSGKGQIEDIDLLLSLAEGIKTGSLCGLGQTAPNAVITTIRHFRNEYEEHIRKHHCRAAVCRGIVSAPCSHTCPAGINVPLYIRYISANKPAEANAVIREKIPFPFVCGLVCFHPCEAKCRRGQVDEAIAIRMLKRFAAENSNEKWKAKSFKRAPTGKKVAIIGSGPAGLTAAYYLAKSGHKLNVFEALSEAGGMLRAGIPDYRLPKDILNSEIEEIVNLGVTISLNTKIESVNKLLERGYHAVFVAVGAHQGLKIGIEGENNPKVVDAASFLKNINYGAKFNVGDSVAVIGGGNVAIDAARCALRLGAKEVKIIYRRTQSEMPASPEEISDAIEEGISICPLLSPLKITETNNKLELVCMRMKLGEVDSSGRPRPEPIKDSEFTLTFDTILPAIGQRPDIPALLNLPIKQGNLIEVDPDTLATKIKGVYAGGDAVTGPASVIEAIAAGRQAAVSIDTYLGGDGNIEEHLVGVEIDGTPFGETIIKPRVKMPKLAAKRRVTSFSDVELGYGRKSAREEADRCLKCDLEEHADEE
jgi:NADH-quinone oxidoreductase subunit F